MNTKNTKEFIINILKDNSDKYISGEYISQQLGLSRASVWKGIKTLRKEGFNITSKNGAGYRLEGKKKESTLSSYEIKYNLNTKYIAQKIYSFDTIDSTNIYANNIAEKSPEGTVIISNEQTDGKGRTGKKWISKENDGVYFSIILKPNIPIIKSSFLTQVAGASLLKTLEKLSVKTEIKWPNDIILNNKKIAGILTEMNAEIDKISYIIVGIGINLYNSEFEKSISNVATSIKKEGYNLNKEQFLKLFFETFEYYYDKFICDDNDEVLKILRDYSAVLGKDIYILKNGEKKIVFAENIDEHGNLVIRNSFGILETIFSGEISIRGLDSYV